ncbi:redox-sensing transcriptional repressor Rex [Telmatocola sphagniphila]|uniref:Redox-sensing transcriptional repressor Rex n=1 Tax=Telmatocola sphagniphila TaxID=1123043 RepID=A0A8E6B444_9BACT|nr:redox-sensing transcriptional repressor Rex [Telmatocola sphagniphila]QVL31588.1 redox-sensing transcriptional repressor Rex [Telmatocola sphagniphila]
MENLTPKKTHLPPPNGASPPKASAHRLSLYLRCLEPLQVAKQETISSKRMAEMLGIRDAQVRRDLTYIGSLGQRGIGYSIPSLIAAIRSALGLNRNWPTILVGVGNLARALIRYQNFREHGFEILALFDCDAGKIGTPIEGMTIQSIGDLRSTLKKVHAELALLTVPAEAAQSTAELLAEAGIRGILNFAPAVLRLPKSVRIVNIDLAMQLEQLAFSVQSAALV